MTPAHIAQLRKETVEMFYHGFDNYMDVAFPEDEVRPFYIVKYLDANLRSCGQCPVYRWLETQGTHATLNSMMFSETIP